MFDNQKEVTETCFLCGRPLDTDPANNNMEHIFPDWILQKYKLQNNFASKYIGWKDRPTNFSRIKISVHVTCNTVFGNTIEHKIRNNRYNNNELWLWVMKIVCGLFFHEYKMFFKMDGYQANVNNQLYTDHFIQFWENQGEILERGEPYYDVPFTVIELDYLFEAERFYHFVHFELGVFWVTLNGRCFLIFYRDKLCEEEMAQAKQHWDAISIENRSLKSESDVQFLYNQYMATVAINVYFSRRCQYWDTSMLIPQFDRPEQSEQLEDALYGDFAIEPIRKNQVILGFKGKPRK